MFTINNISHKNPLLNYIHAFNDTVSCKIFPNLGASIQQLSFNNIDIIDGLDISEDGLESYNEIYQSAILFPFVGRIPNGEYTYQNKSYKLETNETSRSNALHGLIYNKQFTLDSSETSNAKAKVQLSYVSAGNLKGFPFKFNFRVTYTISDKVVKIDFNITNQDNKTLPFGCGWHPYFKSDGLTSSSLSFSSKEKLVCNKKLIPVGITLNKESSTFTLKNKSFDDTFILLKNKINFKTNNYQVQMSFNDSNKNFLQVYTPNHRRSIAIEPVTSVPNTFNTKEDLLELKPNEDYCWKIDLKIKIRE